MHIRQRRARARAVFTARFEPTSGSLFSIPLRSFVGGVLGENLHAAGVGAVWVPSDANADLERRAPQENRDIVDLRSSRSKTPIGTATIRNATFERRCCVTIGHFWTCLAR